MRIAHSAQRILELLEEKGSCLMMPHSEHLDDGSFQIRAKVGDNISGVLYFFVVDLLNEQLKNPEFKKEWDAVEEEYNLIRQKLDAEDEFLMRHSTNEK